VLLLSESYKRVKQRQSSCSRAAPVRRAAACRVAGSMYRACVLCPVLVALDVECAATAATVGPLIVAVPDVFVLGALVQSCGWQRHSKSALA
jgi:hypothetical protein